MVGNTITTTMNKETNKWVFTSFLEKLDIDEKLCKYYIYQQEKCPKTGKLHLQGFIIFKRSEKFKRVKKILNDEKCHIEYANGSNEDCIKYCSKLDTRVSEPIIFGECPKSRQGTRSDIEEFKNFIKEHKENKILWTEINDKFSGIMAKYPKYITECCKNYNKRIIKSDIKRDSMTSLNIIIGETGIGKSTFLKTLEDSYWKNETDFWWDDYNGEENCIFNEYTNETKYNPTELLKLTDHTPYRIQFKGGSCQFTSKHIWISTNMTIINIMNKVSEIHVEAFKRRVTWYTMVDYKLKKI